MPWAGVLSPLTLKEYTANRVSDEELQIMEDMVEEFLRQLAKAEQPAASQI